MLCEVPRVGMHKNPAELRTQEISSCSRFIGGSLVYWGHIILETSIVYRDLGLGLYRDWTATSLTALLLGRNTLQSLRRRKDIDSEAPQLECRFFSVDCASWTLPGVHPAGPEEQ